MERLLVTGIDTLVGTNLALALSDRCEVLGLYDRMAVRCDAFHTRPWQRGDLHALASVFDSWQPQWLVHCGPQSNSSWEEPDCAVDASLEPAVVDRLGELAEHWSCSVVVISSDAVFGGPRMFHDELSPAISTTIRAAQALAVERAAADRNALTVRTHVYGWGVDDEQPSFAEYAYRQLAVGRLPDVNGRRYATPMLASDLAELLWRAHEMRLRGLYHLAGAERTSAYRFSQELAASLGLPVPANAPNETVDASVPHDETSLSSKRARRVLESPTPMLREGLDRFVAQCASGWHKRWECSARVRAFQELAA